MTEPEPKRDKLFPATRNKLAKFFGVRPDQVSMEDILADLNPRTGLIPAERTVGVESFGTLHGRLSYFKGRRKRIDPENQDDPSTQSP